MKLYTEQQVKEMLSVQRTLCMIKASVIGEDLTVKQMKEIFETDEPEFPQSYVSGQLPPLQVTDKEYKKLMKALYPKDRSKKFRR